MAVVLGLLVALTYGAADFLGGLSSRRLAAATVVRSSQAAGFLVLLPAVLLLPGELLGDDLVRGAIAGVVGVVGIVLLYRGLGAGAMSIVAPVTAVGAAVVPFGWGLLQGERPGTLPLVGVALALVAVALVSRPTGDGGPVPGRAKEVALALVAGAAFGVVFILLSSVDEDSGLWPLVAMRVASVSVITTVLLARGNRPALPPRGSRRLVAGAGMLDVSANAIFVFAAREGLLSLVSVISSLYPAATVVLARVVLHERVGRGQQAGLALALAGIVLIAS